MKHILSFKVQLRRKNTNLILQDFLVHLKHSKPFKKDDIGLLEVASRTPVIKGLLSDEYSDPTLPGSLRKDFFMISEFIGEQ
jgi:hypothetical protein